MTGPGFLVDLAIGYRGAKALMVAVRRGVFDVLAEKPATAAQVAATVGWHAGPTAQLMGALGALGIVVEEAGTFRASEIAATYLVRGRPEYIGHALQFADMLWDSWSHLDDSLRTGQPHKQLPELLAAEDGAFTEQYIRGMHGLAQKPARDVARLVGPNPGSSLLDVGCGPGAYSIAMLEAHPELRATLLDLPPTLRIARELLDGHAVAERLRFQEGNYLAGDYGRDHDLVLMSHVTHDESPENVARMFDHAFGSLRSGGRILVHDWVVDENGSSPPFAALFSLHVMLYTNGGRVYRRSEYRKLLERAGFVDVCFATVAADSPNPTTLITADKP